MAENISMSTIINYLEKIGFLFSEGYGKGFPVYTRRGMNIINKSIQLFIETCQQHHIDYQIMAIQHMVDKNQFQKLYTDIHDYSHEIFTYQNYILSSDPLCQTLLYLKQGYQNILTVSAIVRGKSKGLLPLFKDSYIFPVVQFDQSISIEDK